MTQKTAGEDKRAVIVSKLFPEFDQPDLAKKLSLKPKTEVIVCKIRITLEYAISPSDNNERVKFTGFWNMLRTDCSFV